MHVSSSRLFPYSLILFASLGLGGCSSTGSLADAGDRVAQAVKLYKIDVIQGNVVTREQLAALRPGMSRSQVRDVLGTSLLTSVFHEDRWDYVFTLRRINAPPQARKVTVFFKDNEVSRIDADELPSEAEFASTLKSDAKPGTLPPLQASEEALKKFPAPEKAAPAPAAAPAAPATYPPLEPPAK